MIYKTIGKKIQKAREDAGLLLTGIYPGPSLMASENPKELRDEIQMELQSLIDRLVPLP